MLGHLTVAASCMRKDSMCATRKEITNTSEEELVQYVSPRQLAMRWDCSRTTAQRIADRVGIPKYYLGEGKNGLVRYAMQDIESYEVSRRTPVNLRP